MFRIGKATKHTAETRGFHAPGLTGPFGAAAAAGHIAGLDPAAMTNAFGIAGSLCSGLLEFAKSGTGGMVKRLHLGRAAEGGVLAARLAERGFTGPSTVVEGKFGFLNGYCTETDVSALTRGLGREFEVLTICFKRYPCHITAHGPVSVIEEFRREHRFTADDVASVTVTGSAKMAELHNIKEPGDLIMAQYSIPFCVATALCADPVDPASFGERTLHDPKVRALCAKIDVVAARPAFPSAWATTITLRLKDGREFERHADDFVGTPTRPFSRDQLWHKFSLLTRRLEAGSASALFERLLSLEEEPSLDWLSAAPAGQA
jgi:2-methylcitrate dehydratase PrpD